MDRETGAHSAQRGHFAGRPTGFRRLTVGLLQADQVAGRYGGLPEGVGTAGRVLAAFKAAAPFKGYGPRLVHVIDWLFRFTQPQDWEQGRPIVWPSARLQQDELGLGASQVKALTRQLIEAGLITMKDSPNGKRYGRRDAAGRIVEAYGFNLSPLAARHAEFVRVAEEGRALRAELARLRRRATIARNGIIQILETAAEYGFEEPEWAQLAQDSRALTAALRKVERPDEMALGVHSLERRHSAARGRLENLLSTAAPEVSETVDSDPKGPENRPHIYNYKPSPNPEQDTVITSKKNSLPGASTGANQLPPAQSQEEAGNRRAARTNSGTLTKLGPDELTRLAPRLRPYLRNPTPTWPDIVDAADWRRHDLGVSKSLWGEACLTMGREKAAIALAIVSAKPTEHFRTTPGGYFHGMVAKAKAGELHLGRTIWALGCHGITPAGRAGEGRLRALTILAAAP